MPDDDVIEIETYGEPGHGEVRGARFVQENPVTILILDEIAPASWVEAYARAEGVIGFEIVTTDRTETFDVLPDRHYVQRARNTGGYCEPTQRCDDGVMPDAHWSPAVADAEIEAWQAILDGAKR